MNMRFLAVFHSTGNANAPALSFRTRLCRLFLLERILPKVVAAIIVAWPEDMKPAPDLLKALKGDC
jgi:hypothetical protein